MWTLCGNCRPTSVPGEGGLSSKIASLHVISWFLLVEPVCTCIWLGVPSPRETVATLVYKHVLTKCLKRSTNISWSSECCWPYWWCCLFLIQQTRQGYLPWWWPLKDFAGLSTIGHTPSPSSCLDLCCTSDWHSRLLHWWAVSSFWLSVPLCPNGVVSLAPVPQVLSYETRAVL